MGKFDSIKVVESRIVYNKQAKEILDPKEIMNIELVDFNKVLNGVLRDDYLDSALVISTLLVSVKKLIKH